MLDLSVAPILVVSALTLLAILAGAAGERVGAPVLLVFLVVGMLAGPEGLGGLRFENVEAAYALGSAALAVILFDGGARSTPSVLRAGAGPGLALGTLGVVLTAGLAAPAAKYAFGLDWASALLMGAIVSATDAAAVFAILSRSGAASGRLSSALEVESGVNDAMAVALTTALAASLANAEGGLLTALLWAPVQLAGGIVVGAFGGRALAGVMKGVRLAGGLYGLLALAGGLFVFALAQSVSVSGFLAVYVAGVQLARARLAPDRSPNAFLDGFAWLAQVGLFLMLGLMAAPSHLAGLAGPSLGFAVALAVLARPIAVFACLAPFGWRLSEIAFAAWVGLRGATPIFLALTPALFGAPNASLYFAAAAGVVLVSLVAQGWTVEAAARLFGLAPKPPDQRTARRAGWARLAAMGACFAAGGAYALTSAAPPPGSATVTLSTPETLAELAVALEEAPVQVAGFPAGFAEAPAETRQTAFAAVVRAALERANAEAAAERAEVQGMVQSREDGRRLSVAQDERLAELAQIYGARFGDMEDLLARIDALPAALGVAQAALASGWGSSPRALSANDVFGRGRTYEDIDAAARDYLRFLNTGPAFEDLRATRAALRAQERALEPLTLIPHLHPYAADGPTYVDRVTRIAQTLEAAG